MDTFIQNFIKANCSDFKDTQFISPYDLTVHK